MRRSSRARTLCVVPDALAKLTCPTVRRSMRQVLWHLPDVDPSIVRALWESPDALVAGGVPLKDQPGDRCTVTRVETPGRAYVIKRYNLRGPLHTARHLLIRSRARWSWLAAQRITAAGLKTPVPLAMVEHRFGLARLRSFLVTEFIDAQPLDAVVTAVAQDDADQMARLADAMSHVWLALGSARLAHRDMKASNFLVDRAGAIWLIDLDAVRPIASGFAAKRRKDRDRFLRNWHDQPAIVEVFQRALDDSC